VAVSCGLTFEFSRAEGVGSNEWLCSALAAHEGEQMERPKITRELIAATASAFCARNGWDANQAVDLGKVYRGGHMDGYALAKALDDGCGWSIQAHDVDTLDCFFGDVREAHRQACITWASDNNVQPPLPVGTMTTQGEITGIYAHDAACYEILKQGDTDPTRRYIVRFEDARAAPAAVAG
jgi:hypothetical protein